MITLRVRLVSDQGKIMKQSEEVIFGTIHTLT